MYQFISNFTTGGLFALTLGVIACLFFFYGQAELHSSRALRLAAQAAASQKKNAQESPSSEAQFHFHLPYHPMTKQDRLPVLLITAIYLVIALVNLGSRTDPETFAHFTQTDSVAEFQLSEPTEISDVWYYTGLYSGGSFSITYSEDGTNWAQLGEDIVQRYNTLFKWEDLELETSFTAQYLRLTLTDGTDLALGELALFDSSGNLIDLSNATVLNDLSALLVDEQDSVPQEISFMNSTYFDEIYHARTAYEHLNNVYPYEVSHPPLGKLILSIGITIFGMNPFGWRIMGTLFGVGMLPILYLFLKNLFGKTPLATCGTLLFAFDFMHFAQTRIATIDTYSVFFVLLSFYFLYRYFTVPQGAKQTDSLRKELVPLGLCGLFFGIGSACKWTVIYAGGGLCILYFWNLFLRWHRRQRGDRFFRWMVITLASSVVFFLVIPGIIYTASYLPYAIASGNSVFQEMVKNQVFMLTYHNGVNQEHPYSSRWWQWIFNIRPILYYLQYNDNGTKACIASFGNPMVVWGGLAAEVVLLVTAIRRKAASGLAAFLFVAWAVELIPWIIISRTEFEYHYFGCILFLVFAIVFVMDRLWTLSSGRGKAVIYLYTSYALFLFALFYPVLSGLTVPTSYCYLFLKWFPTWPLG